MAVLFAKQLIRIDDFPLHIDMANINPVIFAENYLNDSNVVINNIYSELKAESNNFNFLFLKPEKCQSETNGYENYCFDFIVGFLNIFGDF